MKKIIEGEEERAFRAEGLASQEFEESHGDGVHL